MIYLSLSWSINVVLGVKPASAKLRDSPSCGFPVPFPAMGPVPISREVTCSGAKPLTAESPDAASLLHSGGRARPDFPGKTRSAVQGHDGYGQYPVIGQNQANDSGEGRLIPTTSVDQDVGTGALWFGLSDSQIRASLTELFQLRIEPYLGFMSQG
jgi:hypothetical protein